MVKNKKEVKTIMTSYYLNKRGRSDDKLLFSVKNQNGEKYYHIIEKPVYNYFISKKKLKRHYLRVPYDSVVEHTCYYSDLLLDVSRKLDKLALYNYGKANKDMNTVRRRLINDFNVHGIDVDIEDKYRASFKEKYEQNKEIELDVMFYDIETNVEGKVEFVESIVADVPINLINIVHGDKIITLATKYDTVKDSVALVEDKEELSNFKKMIEDKYNNEFDWYPVWFDDELKMLKYFFKYVIDEKPDMAAGWNSNTYDLPFILSRLMILTGSEVENPEPYYGKKYFNYSEKVAKIVIDPHLFKQGFRRIKYIRNLKSAPINKDSHFKIPGHTQWVDQMYIFAELTRNKVEPSYSLSAISIKYLGEDKITLPPGVDYGNFYRKDYKLFLEYGIHDTMLLKKIEHIKGHLSLAFLLSDSSGTRFEKTLKKTIHIPNLARMFYKKSGYILSNNRDNDKGGTFHGGFVADPKLLADVGYELFPGVRLKYVFDNVGDLDLKAQYPNVIITFDVDEENMLGKLVIPVRYTSDEFSNNPRIRKQGLVMEEFENGDRLVDIGSKLIEGYLSKDYIKLGKEYMGLPDLEDIVKYINEEIYHGKE